jgi:exodeoxyribonuclease-3
MGRLQKESPMARIITVNVNGIRAAQRKGLFPWLETQQADVICLQEVRAQAEQIDSEAFHLPGYHRYLHLAEKKGYSGVALYSRHKPKKVHYGLGWPSADDEGRYLQADFQSISIASLYLPSGSSSEARQDVKFDFLERYQSLLAQQREQALLICGDWNIAHTQQDIKNWRANQKNSGFLPEERAWLDHLFEQLNYSDVFRSLNQDDDQYTWWSNRGRAWDNNVGWRIDYHVASPSLKGHAQKASIYKQQRFSDHAPLMIDYAFDLA